MQVNDKKMVEILNDFSGVITELNTEIRTRELLESSGVLTEMYLNNRALIEIADTFNELIYSCFYENPEDYYKVLSDYVSSKYTPMPTSPFPSFVNFFYTNNREDITFSILQGLSSVPLLIQVMYLRLSDELMLTPFLGL